MEKLPQRGLKSSCFLDLRKLSFQRKGEGLLAPFEGRNQRKANLTVHSVRKEGIEARQGRPLLWESQSSCPRLTSGRFFHPCLRGRLWIYEKICQWTYTSVPVDRESRRDSVHARRVSNGADPPRDGQRRVGAESRRERRGPPADAIAGVLLQSRGLW